MKSAPREPIQDDGLQKILNALSDIEQLKALESPTGGGAPANHNILSATHGDSTAAAAQRGDLIVGQGASPKWARLGIGGVGTILRSDGVDAGWASLSAAGIIGGTIGATQVAYGSGVNTITGSQKFTWGSNLLTLRADAGDNIGIHHVVGTGAASSSVLYTGTLVTGTSLDNGANAWGAPNEIRYDDDIYAGSVGGTVGGQIEDTLIVTINAGATIPPSALITGIQVVVKHESTGSADKWAVDYDLGVWIGGVRIGANRAEAGIWPTTWEYVTYGGDGDTWESGITAADIIAGDVAIGLQPIVYKLVGGSNTYFRADYLSIRIYYTTEPEWTSGVEENSNLYVIQPGSVIGTSGFLFWTNGKLTIPALTGTPPLVVGSTTKVINLNADLLDDLHTSSNPGIAAAVLATNASGQLTLSGQLTVDHVQFDLTPITATPAEGRLYWDVDDGTVNVGMPGGNVNLQLGQEGLVRVKNETGAPIANGQLVYISGGTGNRPLITLAKADAEATSASTLGMATEGIAHNGQGYVTSWGYVRDVDTLAYAPGTILYLSASTAGEYTSTKPDAPNHLVTIGQVIRQHATEGIIYLRIDNGYELSELHDVCINPGTLANLDILQYIAANTRWENKTLSGAGIIGGTIGATQVAYGSAANVIAGSANFTWDNANQWLGVGTAAPIYGLDVVRQSGEATLGLTSYADSSQPTFRFRRAKGSLASPATPTSGQGMLSMLGMLWDGAAFQNSVQILAQADASAGAGSTPGRWIFLTTPSGSTTLAERMRIDSAGLIGIGIAAPTCNLHIVRTTATTAAIDTVATIGANSTGTALAGFGAALAWTLESSTTNNQDAAKISALWNVATHGSRAADLVAGVYDYNGTREIWRGRASGSAPMLGFYGATPVVRATTGVGAAAFVQNAGNAVNDASTFDGYTLTQITKALRDIGILT